MHDWTEVAIGDVLTFQRGFDITRHAQRDGTVPVVSSGGVGSFHDTAAATGPGVVIGRKGTLGKVFYMPGDYWPHDTTLWVKDFKGNIPRFVYYFMLNQDVRWLDGGSANPTLNRNHLHPLRAHWPPLLEQEKVAEVLGSIDDKIHANCRVIDISTELGCLSVARNSTPGVTVAMSELIVSGDLILGDGYRTSRREHASAGYTIIRAADIEGGRISFNGIDRVSADREGAIGTKVVYGGDVALTTKGTIGRVGAVRRDPPRAVYSPQVCFFRVLNSRRLTPAFLRYWLESDEFWAQARNAMHNTDMAPYISRTDLRSFRISVPSDLADGDTGRQIDSLLELSHALEAENEKLAELRDTLLPHLMSGRLKIKDAEGLMGDVV
jgi:type I restriction enzyme S subunit